MADINKPIGIIKRVFQVPDEIANDRALARIKKVINDYAKEVSSSVEAMPVKIKHISVIGSDDNHTIFGLGDDNQPYVWQDGRWIAHI